MIPRTQIETDKDSCDTQAPESCQKASSVTCDLHASDSSLLESMQIPVNSPDFHSSESHDKCAIESISTQNTEQTEECVSEPLSESCDKCIPADFPDSGDKSVGKLTEEVFVNYSVPELKEQDPCQSSSSTPFETASSELEFLEGVKQIPVQLQSEIARTLDEMPSGIIEKHDEWAALEALSEASSSSLEEEASRDWVTAERSMGVGVLGMGRVIRARHRARLEAHMDWNQSHQKSDVPLVVQEEVVPNVEEVIHQEFVPKIRKKRTVSFDESRMPLQERQEDQLDVRERSRSAYGWGSLGQGSMPWWQVPPDHSYHQVLSLLVCNSPHHDVSVLCFDFSVLYLFLTNTIYSRRF